MDDPEKEATVAAKISRNVDTGLASGVTGDSKVTAPAITETAASTIEKGQEEPTDVPEGAALQGTAYYVTLIATILAVLLVAFNATILGTATPSITSEFHTVEDVGWYAAAYLISTCAMTPLMGSLYRLFNIKYLSLAMIGVFVVGSAICGSATSSDILIFGRAICGIGSSGIIQGMLTIAALTIPLQRRAMVNGIVMASLTVGQTAGPVVGGLLAGFASWRWCFYINLPLGAAVMLGFGIFVKLPAAHLVTSSDTFVQKFMKIDIAGFLLFGAACVMLLLGLEWGGSSYPWTSAVVIGLLCGGLVAFICLVAWLIHKQDAALIPPRLLKSRVNISLVVTAFLQGGGIYLTAYWLAIWFQGVKEASPLISGVMILPTAISQIFSSLLCGALIQRWGYYLPEVLAGNMLVAVGSGLMSTFAPSSSEGEWIGYQILIGAGRGFALQLLPTAMQTNLPAEDASIGSSTVMFAQYFGGAIFSSIAKTVFTAALPAAVEKYAPGLNPSVLINNGVTSLSSAIPAEYHTGALLAYNEALDRVFDVQLASACAAVIAGMFVGWRKITPKKKGLGSVPKSSEKRDTGSAETEKPMIKDEGKEASA